LRILLCAGLGRLEELSRLASGVAKDARIPVGQAKRKTTVGKIGSGVMHNNGVDSLRSLCRNFIAAMRNKNRDRPKHLTKGYRRIASWLQMFG
jgi:hypothetical protein